MRRAKLQSPTPRAATEHRSEHKQVGGFDPPTVPHESVVFSTHNLKNQCLHRLVSPKTFSEHTQAASMVLSTTLNEVKGSLTSCGRGPSETFAGKSHVSDKGFG